jgi:diacylglycerol kinase family enzyme
MAKRNINNGARVILLSNQLSTRNRDDLVNVRKVADRYPFVLHLEGQSLKRLYKQLETFRGKSPELLILNGGDGTIHTALTFLMNNKIFKKMPAIAILGGGMTNMNAKDLNTGGVPSRALRNILGCFEDHACQSLFEDRYLLKVEFANGKAPEFGMFFGGAAFVNAIRFCVNRIYSIGIKGGGSQVITLMMVFLSLLFRRHSKGSLAYSPDLTLTFDDKEIANTKYFCLSSTTLHKLIFGSKAPHVPGTFPFFTLKPSFFSLLSAFFLARRGTIQNSRNRNIDLRFVKKVKIEGDTEIVLDGEIYNAEGGALTLSTAGPLKFVSFNKG